MKPFLYAPPSFWAASPDARAMLINGCGPGGWKVDLIPDKLWGLSIHDACDIHDWMYACGETIDDKHEADRVFLNNMLRLISSNRSPAILKTLRRKSARGYYLAVSDFGGPAFWDGKNPDETLGHGVAA